MARTRIRPLALLALALAATTQAAHVWIEAEDHAACNFKHFETSSMGKPALLSGGKWIMKGMDPAAVKQLVPDEGIRLTYKVHSPAPGQYTLWMRIGWFGARANCRVRVGAGKWLDVPKTYPTINLMELGFFCEVSWANLGTVALAKGETTLEVHFPKTAGPKDRMLCALDCFAFVDGPFTPEGPFKPGQTYADGLSKQAAAHAFTLPAPKGVERTQVKLVGPWQVARYDDPDMDKDTYVPVQKLPAPADYRLRWMGMQVPGSVWKVPPLVFGHRLVYRTRVRVPAEHRGRGFKLHFSGTHWIVSVFVDGALAGTHQGVWVPWDLDITKHVTPGKTHELAVAVKGTYYAFDGKALGGGGISRQRNRPYSRKKWTRWVAPIYPSTKGDGDGYEYGIVNPVTLVSVGNAYAEDVFVKPSVAKKQLGLELTVRNTSARPRTLSVKCEAISVRTNQVDKTFALPQLTVAPNASATLQAAPAWESPKLWWPKPDPDLYRLRTTLSEAGRTVDVHEQLFGFREVTLQGPGIYINGVRRNVWNWVDVHAGTIKKPEDWAEALHQDRSRFMRFSHGRRITQVLKTREERLDFYDRAGIPGRLCTMIDGMFISYNLGLRTREKDAKGRPLLKPNTLLWRNFRRHMAQVAKAYRNHPSVIFYQVENELVYINGMNIYGGYLDTVEELMAEVCEAGRKVDPTRPYTVGGGGDLSGKLEINSPHYPHTAFDYYPENAYTLDHYATKIQRWPWTRKKPWVVGESLFANELSLGAYADGDVVFRGKHEALRGKAKFLRMIYGGYRWAGVAGFFPWDNLWQFPDSQKMFSALCVIPRKQTHRLFGRRENEILVKVMNDTLSAEPVTLEWTYGASGGEDPSRPISPENRSMGMWTLGKITLNVEPGFGTEHTIVIKAMETRRRVNGTLTLIARQKGAEDYVDKRSVPILPGGYTRGPSAAIYVFDRKGALTKHLAANSLKCQKIDSLDAVKGRTGLLLIGHDTLTPQEAFGTGLLAFAAAGGRVICLEQDNPPAGAALPAPLKPTRRFAGYVHPQALGTPLFRDLGKDDLIDWAGDYPTAKNLYRKPSQGGRSLAECGGSLGFSPLIEVPCGKGVILLCQLRVGAKLGIDPAADVLLRNFIDAYGDYKPTSGVAAVYSPDDRLLADKVRATGVLTATVGGIAQALDPTKHKVALLQASEKNLKTLLGLKQKAAAFQDAGGWIMLCGLGPKGLDELNALVGADHMLRPFRVERVTMENPQFPLAATLGNRDVALYSPQVIMHGRYWVSGNTYSHVVDGRDLAPFTLPPGAPDDPFAYKPTRDDHDPYNFVNGMINSDFWRYIRQIWIEKKPDGPVGFDHVFRLRRPDTVKQINIWNNANYSTIEKLDIIFDGDDANAVSVVLPDAAELKQVVLPQPRKVRKTIALRIKTWRIRPHKHPNVGNLVGIDNVQFLRPAAPKGAVFLDNVGGLVAFPRGKGGVFLNQLKFTAEEPRPENAGKKLRILGVVLQNMGVGFRSAAVVAVPGVNVRFNTVNIQEYCTAYLDDKSGKAGWFGRKGQDLAILPRGRQDLADVTYHVVDYKTAPIPDCIILGGPRAHPSAIRRLPEKVDGIKVGHKADLLFFLHTAFVARPITGRERQQMTARRRRFVLPTIHKYVLHYADGQTADIPVVLERHIDDWLKEKATPLMGAQIAWSRPLAAVQGKRAVVYSMQAPNPRPDVPISTISVVRASTRATPAVLAISTGTVLPATH